MKKSPRIKKCEKFIFILLLLINKKTKSEINTSNPWNRINEETPSRAPLIAKSDNFNDFFVIKYIKLKTDQFQKKLMKLI